MSERRRVDMGQIAELAQLVREHASSFDDRCDLTPEVADALTRSDLMRILIPADYGGLDGTFVDWFRACLPVAVADGSAGWIASQGAVQNMMVASQSEPSFARPFAASERVNTAISNVGDTKLEALPDGRWCVSGQWSYESGSLSATFIGGQFSFADETIEPKPGLSIVMLAEDEVEIERTWNPLGMRGTGSNRVTVDNVVVSADRLMYFRNPDETKFPSHPLGRLGSGTALISSAIATTMLGVSRRALDEATEILGGKPDRGLYGDGELKIKHPRVLAELIGAESRWRLIHDGYESALNRLWLRASAPEWPSEKVIAEAVLTAATAGQTCLEIVRSVYALCGSSAATKLGTPLERCFRDATTLSSHLGIAPSAVERHGSLFYELPSDD